MATSTPLSLSNLPALSPNLSVPSYSKTVIQPGILHFGLGNFHRAHQALHLHRLFQSARALDWGIVGATVRKEDQPLYDALSRQDLLYTLVEQSSTTSTASIISSLHSYIPPAAFDQILHTLSQPSIRIVSLTITEGGYFLNEQTGLFDGSHPDILADVSSPSPETVFGLIVASLRIRRAANTPPFTVMSCDNVPHNGRVARDAVVGLASLLDTELADWISQNVAFPNSMVDRITPVTTERERKAVREEWGVADDAPVFCESYLQWVLEDKFTCGRPPLEDVGVTFVDDVTPFEMMKIRILNGGHAAIAYPAGLLGIQFAYEAMQDSLIKQFLLKVEKDEIVPVVPPVPGMDLQDYLETVCERFANPNIEDTVSRLCYDGYNRQPKFIIPSIRDCVSQQTCVEGLALASAFWCRYCFGVNEVGEEIEANAPNWDETLPIAQSSKEDPMAWLRQERLYGSLIGEDKFSEAFCRWLRLLWENGTIHVLNAYLETS